MKIRLGYACISETLNITSSSPFTYTNYLKEKNLDKLYQISKNNLLNLYEILKYNGKNNIHFFRLSSKLIPLATKDDVDFDYINSFLTEYKKITSIIKKNKLRIDFHPDQFCVLNSTKEDVIKNSIKILEYHYNLLNVLKIKNKILVLHIGSSVFGKDNSLKRFINTFNKLPKHLQDIIAIENDDKVFNLEDCIKISKIIDCPIVLDYHHFRCNHDKKKIEKLLPDVIKSWKKETPKMHFSSPKNNTKKDFRSHHDYINCDEFIKFLKILKKFNTDIDIMIEAKKKDEALFRLVRELKYKTNYKFIDETTFIL